MNDNGEVLGMGCSLVNCSGQLFIRHMVVLPAAKLDEREVGLAWSSPEPFETATRDPGNYFEPVIAWCKISATSG